VNLLYEIRAHLSKGHYDQKVDVFDLDPYGTATPFLDGAI